MIGTLPFRTLACALGLLAPLGVVGRAAAQAPPPVEPTGDEPTAAPESPGVTGGQPRAGLAMNASIGGGWDSNADFVAQGEGSASAFGQAMLVRTWRIPQWTISADANAGGSVYRTDVARNRYRYGGALSALGRAGTRTDLTFTGSAGVEYTDTDYLDDPAAAGLALPLTLSKRFRGSAGLGRLLGAQTRLDLGAGYGRYYFDSEDLADGEGVLARSSLSRTLSPQDTASFSYFFQSNRYGAGSRSRIHTFTGGYTRTLSERMMMRVSLGTDGRFFEGGDVRWTLNADGTISYQANRTNWRLRYRRAVTPGPGLGTDRILNLFSLTFASTPRTWLTLNVTGSHGFNQDPVAPDISYSTDTVYASLRLRLTPTLGLAPQLRYRRRGEVNENPPVDSFRVSLALDYAGFIR